MAGGLRIVRAVDRRIQMVRHRGDSVSCPLCGHEFADFKPDNGRLDVLCWRCGSHERHRAQWLLFEQRQPLLPEARSLLHFAPEWTLRRHLQRIPRLRYVTADLWQPDVDLRLDVAALALADSSFDAVICSHVLEHVADDAAAMRELRRIVAPAGWCLVMVPLDVTRECTYEDPSLRDPQDRRRAFGAADHLRLYGLDISERLTTAGFDVERIVPQEAFGETLARRCRIQAVDQMFLCRPASASR